MLKKHLAACLVATAFAGVPAMAQTSTTSPSGATDRPAASGSGSATTGSPAMQPGAPNSVPSGSAGTTSPSGAAPATGTSTTGAAPSTGQSTMAQTDAQGPFVTTLEPSHVMASKLIGTTVVGANNESIGDVNDVLLDRDGRAVAVVIGVGGFLGIGEKNVAVSFSELDFATVPTAAGSSGQTTPSDGGSVSSTGSTGSTSASNRSTATTGNTGSGDPNTNASTATDGGVPQRVVLRMTKDDLKNAPTFRSGARENAGSGAGTGGAGSAPSTQQ